MWDVHCKAMSEQDMRICERVVRRVSWGREEWLFVCVCVGGGVQKCAAISQSIHLLLWV